MDQSDQRDAAPLRIPGPNEPAEQLEQFSEGNPPFREKRLQKLIVENPGVLPVSEIEPAYAPLVSLGTEISVPSGSLDALYVSPSGYPTLVETKMWDNPEARREVVGQIVEYAKDLSQWGFDDLDQAVQKADESGKSGILERVQREGHDIDPSSFIDTIARKLHRGEFLLLVVGNGIRENLKSLTSYLQGAPDLHFSLRLVELALYRFESKQDWPLFVQPRVVARTSEVTRAVVEIETSDDVEVTVDLPSEEEEESSGRGKLTEKAFYEQLAKNTSQDVAEEVKALVEDITELGVKIVPRKSSISPPPRSRQFRP